jgi:hypothetical protein
MAKELAVAEPRWAYGIMRNLPEFRCVYYMAFKAACKKLELTTKQLTELFSDYKPEVHDAAWIALTKQRSIAGDAITRKEQTNETISNDCCAARECEHQRNGGCM